MFEKPAGHWRQVVSALLFAVLFFTATFVLSAAAAWALRSLTASPLALNAVSLFVGAGAVTALLLRAPPARPWSALGLGPDFARPLLLGLALGAGSCALIVAAMQAAGWASWTPIDPSAIRFDWRGSVGTGLLLLAVGAAGEELFVRGYLLQQLGRALTPLGRGRSDLRGVCAAACGESRRYLAGGREYGALRRRFRPRGSVAAVVVGVPWRTLLLELRGSVAWRQRFGHYN